MWSEERRRRWAEAYAELSAADRAYHALPLNEHGHLEIGVPPESEAWDAASVPRPLMTRYVGVNPGTA